jgi:predicted DNA-binding transcriptional regulator AlpA
MAARSIGYEGVAQMTGLKVRTIKSLVASQGIPHFRYSPRVVRFDPDKVEAWMRDRAVEPASVPACNSNVQSLEKT